MAGIGFELRKIYRKHTLSAAVWGSIYASLSAIGPTILFSGLMVLLHLLLNLFETPLQQRQLFTASFTWICLIAVIISCGISTVLSRYVSDCIFSSRNADISASVFGSALFSAGLSGIVLLVICLFMKLKMEVSAWFCLLYYLTGTGVCVSYTIMTFITTIKEYRKVSACYLLAGTCTLFTALILHFLGCSDLTGMYTGLMLGFWLMNFLLIALSVKSFGKPSAKYFTFIRWFRKYPVLALGSILYILGFYLPAVIYWFFSPMKLQAGIFCVAPGYDLALFLSVITSMPALVLFIVRTETSFSEQCRQYLSAIGSASFERIEKERDRLVQQTDTDLFAVCEIQLLLCVIIICLINVFFPYLGMTTEVLNQFSLLALGNYCISCMYFTVILFYYFEDYKQAAVGPAILFGVGLAGSLLCALVIQDWYPLPWLIGGLLSWAVSFLLLRRRMDSLNAFLMCKE